MKQKGIYGLTFLIVFSVLLPTTAYANSSWHWLTETNPFDVLPYAVALTLLIEYIIIKRVNSITHPLKLFIVICFANAVSFLLPYAFLLLPNAVGYTFEMSIMHRPIYVVGLFYLFLTLLAEIPVVYLSFMKSVRNRKAFILSIVLVNVVTTILVAVMERVICRGAW